MAPLVADASVAPDGDLASRSAVELSVVSDGVRKTAAVQDGRVVTRAPAASARAGIRDESAGGAWHVDYAAPLSDDTLPIRWSRD